MQNIFNSIYVHWIRAGYHFHTIFTEPLKNFLLFYLVKQRYVLQKDFKR